ncbi:hypothetical protein KIL84_004430 [Mauremys mutica]|uniref:Uncharacterized protein n=1 Tax=Mauremys mutica TaxID=74926 RepID=A0A9D4B6B0_9SAUR|nr:hypothetical protein KIL84_004430 [Mauremys mutica]
MCMQRLESTGNWSTQLHPDTAGHWAVGAPMKSKYHRAGAAPLGGCAVEVVTLTSYPIFPWRQRSKGMSYSNDNVAQRLCTGTILWGTLSINNGKTMTYSADYSLSPFPSSML